MKTRQFLLLGFSLIEASAFAAGAGTSAAGFLRMGAGARAAGMGEAYSTLVDDAEAMYWNPAALSMIQGQSVTLMHAPSAESTAYSYAAYGQSLGETGGFGLSLQHQTAGPIPQLDASGNESGSFTPTDTAFSLGGARRMGPVALGVTAKSVQSKVVDSGSAVAGDVGLLVPDLWGGKLGFALTATNVGGKIQYAHSSEDLPSEYRAGLGYHPMPKWSLGVDGVKPKDGSAYVAAGVEAGLVSSGKFSLALRAGYNTRSSGDAGGLSGAAFGLGFGFDGMRVDYAFRPMGDLGATHLISLSYAFGGKSATPSDSGTTKAAPVMKHSTASPAKSNAVSTKSGSTTGAPAVPVRRRPNLQ